MVAATFGKAERLNRRVLIDNLFSEAASSFVTYPLRVVYLPSYDLGVPASVLVSVSKRHFKRAVKRNRVKRQIREAYRLHKTLLPADKHWFIAFIYLSDDILPTSTIAECMKSALIRIGNT